MTNKKFWLAMLVIALVFGMAVVGCDNGSTGGGGDSGLTITGLGDYNGKYAVAGVNGADIYAAASVDMKKQIITGGKISGGSVTLKVWKMEAEGKVSSYKGNDTVGMSVMIYDKASVLDDEPIAGGIVTVTFKNGVASGACVVIY